MTYDIQLLLMSINFSQSQNTVMSVRPGQKLAVSHKPPFRSRAFRRGETVVDWAKEPGELLAEKNVSCFNSHRNLCSRWSTWLVISWGLSWGGCNWKRVGYPFPSKWGGGNTWKGWKTNRKRICSELKRLHCALGIDRYTIDGGPNPANQLGAISTA